MLVCVVDVEITRENIQIYLLNSNDVTLLLTDDADGIVANCRHEVIVGDYQH